MERLASKDFRRILAFAQQMYAVQNHETLIDTSVRGLQSLIQGEVHSYSETNHREHTTIIKDSPGGPELTPSQKECYAQFAHQHPGIVYFQKTWDGQAFTISDFLPISDWCQTDLYNHVYRPHRLKDCLGCGLSVSSTNDVVSVFGVHRAKRNHSARDRMVLNLIRPHFLQAYGNAQIFTKMERRMAALSKAVDQLDQAIVEMDKNGKVMWATEKGKTLLQKMGRQGSRKAESLPSVIANWMQACCKQLADSDNIPIPLLPIIVETESSVIRIRLARDGDTSLLFLEESLYSLPLERLNCLGLTQRETEVLGWVAQGKSNPEIADILGIGVGTVKTHLERIFVKLGVDHRQAAMALALDVLHKGERN